MTDARSRAVPRPFSLHWGEGQIVEEASYQGLHHQPTVQLLHFDGGTEAVRFSHYSHTGRFQRNPLIVGEDEIAGLREALNETPQLRSLLTRMVE